MEAIKKPVLFLYSANDKMIPDEFREKIQGILKTKPFPTDGVYYPDQASLQVSEKGHVGAAKRVFETYWCGGHRLLSTSTDELLLSAEPAGGPLFWGCMCRVAIVCKPSGTSL